MQSYLLVFCKMVVFFTFLFSSSQKLKNIVAFEYTIKSLNLVPGYLQKTITKIIIILEMISAVFVLFGSILQIIGFSLAVILLGIFTFIILFELKGNSIISCNCFGSYSSTFNKYDIIRNLNFIMCSMVGFIMSVFYTGLQPEIKFYEAFILTIVAAIFIAINIFLLQIRKLINSKD